jgi:hypothetical protein
MFLPYFVPGWFLPSEPTIVRRVLCLVALLAIVVTLAAVLGLIMSPFIDVNATAPRGPLGLVLSIFIFGALWGCANGLLCTGPRLLQSLVQRFRKP